jgi:VWFA-related protein
MRLRPRRSASRSFQLIGGITLVAASSALALAVAQEQQPAFRSGVDVIAVDVQVVDKTGLPVTGLRADQFDVSIDGKPRKVVSADLIRTDAQTSAASTTAAIGAESAVATSPLASPDTQRIYILAFDSVSFPPLDIAAAREAAHAFVDKLPSRDLAGLFIFPQGVIVNPSTDRALLLHEIDRVVGQAIVGVDQYHLVPSEIVDISRAVSYPTNQADIDQKIANICSNDRDPEMCFRGIVSYGHMEADMREMEISQRLGALQGMFRSLAQSPARKVVVLISEGLMDADRVDGRPKLGDLGRAIGQGAAEANCLVYALYFDRLRSDLMSASTGRPRQYEFARDTAILEQGLDRISGASGGTFYRIVQGGGEFAFDQILKETAAYYLLGVAPNDKDRDGRAHELHVKVAQKDAVVRGRSWVTLPKPDAVARTGAPSMGAAGATLDIRKPAPNPLTGSARQVADAYGRRDYASIERLEGRSGDLAAVMRDVRAADSPWPDAPRRAQVFSLELGLAGLQSENGFAREEGQRLLTHAHLTVEQTGHGDAFACAWFHTEVAALESFWQPELGLAFVERARQQCPAEPRLNLARAVLLDQQWQELKDPKRALDVVAAYADVGGGAALEARVRAAYLCYRIGDLARGAELMPESIAPDTDPYVRYLYQLVLGHLLRARGRIDDAVAAYQKALDIAPGAQSARVALMTLRLGQGQSAEAFALADAIQTPKRDEIDPWWTYSRGDARAYAALLDHLRELAQ